MAVSKLSQIAASSPPATTDTVVGVQGGNTDAQYTFSTLSANPTATASDVAVNGSAATFMRSDGAPAVQLTSSSQFGLCKVDNSTITAAGGVISVAGGAGTVNSVSNIDGTLTISPTTGSVVASLALAHANTWTAIQTFANSDIVLRGSSTGATTFTSANAGASNFTLTFPAVTDTIAVLGTAQTFSAKQTFSTGGPAVNITDTTAGSSSTTGALVVAGGVGIAKNINFPSSTSTVGLISWSGFKLSFDAGGNIFFAAGNFTVSGIRNLAMIGQALQSVSTGHDNIAFGQVAAGLLTTGNFNIAIGNSALGGSQGTALTADENTCVGNNAAQFLHGAATKNTCIGAQSAQVLATGSSNTLIGWGNGFNYNAAESNNTIIGASIGGTAGQSNVVVLGDGAGNIRLDYNSTNANGWSLASGLVVGAATGGYLGAGTINVSTGISLNNTAYTNPDYVLEHYYTGKISKFAKKPKASDYPGLMPLDELGDFVEENWYLPRISREPSDIFERGDMALEKIEELTLYILKLHEEIEELKKWRRSANS